MSNEDVKTVSHSLLKVAWKCGGHCKEMANVEFLNDGSMAAQVCPGGYVSRIIAYGKQVDPVRLKDFVREATPGMVGVEDSDIRVASRYAWDLGLERENNELILKEAYWTQSYRRTRSDSPDRLALFLCSNKDSFFVQPLNSNERLCQSCRKKS